MYNSLGYNACACLGPQEGEPVCPCAIRWVKVIDNRYVNSKGEDLGPFIIVNKSRVIKSSWNDGCNHLQHNPNIDIINSLAIDEAYIHVCPQCKEEYRCMPTTKTFLKHFFKMKKRVDKTFAICYK